MTYFYVMPIYIHNKGLLIKYFMYYNSKNIHFYKLYHKNDYMVELT